MSRQARLLLPLPLLLLFLSSGCTRAEGELGSGFEAGQYRTIVAFGDSIVQGYRQPEGWPEILGRELSVKYGGIQVINAGRPGDTAADGLDRLQESVLNKTPDLVLISFGLNDMKNGRTVDVFASDLERIVEKIVESGAEPVLLTTTPLQNGTGLVVRLSPEPFNEAIRRIASRKAVPLIDVYEEFKGFNTARYLMDVAHPNAEGYRVLADIIGKRMVGE